MQHAAGVGVAERRCHVVGDLERRLERQAPLPLQPRMQGLALHVRHDVVEHSPTVPESVSGTMSGWLIDFATRISRRKRSAPSASASLGCMTLIATGSPAPRSRASYTVAMPPRASSRSRT